MQSYLAIHQLESTVVSVCSIGTEHVLAVPLPNVRAWRQTPNRTDLQARQNEWIVQRNTIAGAPNLLQTFALLIVTATTQFDNFTAFMIAASGSGQVGGANDLKYLPINAHLTCIAPRLFDFSGPRSIPASR